MGQSILKIILQCAYYICAGAHVHTTHVYNNTLTCRIRIEK